MAKKSNKKSTNRKKLVANKAFKYQPGGNPYATPGSFTPASMSGAHQAQMQLAQIQNEMMQAQQQEQEANRLAQEEERKATMSSLATQGAQLGKTAKTAIAAGKKAGKTAMQGLNNANVIGSAASLAGMGIQKLSDDDDDTRINFGEGLGGIMKGAGAGAAWGSALGPVGTAIGGLAGAGLSTYQMIKSRNQAREDEERDADYRLRMAEAQQRMAETAFSRTGSDIGFNVGPSMTNAYLPGQQMMAYQMGGGREMLKRADGSYSQRGLWDNIRANKGSGNAPTKQMLKQEKKIKQKGKYQGGTPAGQSVLAMNDPMAGYRQNPINIPTNPTQGDALMSMSDKEMNANEQRVLNQQMNANIERNKNAAIQIVQNPELAMDIGQLGLQGVATSEIPIASQIAGGVNALGYLGRGAYYGAKGAATEDAGYGAKGAFYGTMGAMSGAGMIPGLGAAADASTMASMATKIQQGLNAAHHSQVGHLMHAASTGSKEINAFTAGMINPMNIAKKGISQAQDYIQSYEAGGDPEKKALRKQNRQTKRAQRRFERKSKKGIQNTFQNGGESIMTSANNPQVGVVYDMGLTTNEHFDAPKIEVPSEGRYVKNATVQVDPRVSLPHRVMGFENAATYRNIGIPLNSRNNLFGPPVDFSRADSKNPNVFDTKNTTYQNQSFISPDSRLDFSNRNTNQTPDITIVYPQDEYKTGGQKVPGGMIKPLPGGAVEFVGPKHSQGGIMLDSQTEVEGGETMDKVKFAQGGNTGDYIFSDYLKLGGKTFAKRHKEMLNNGASQADIQNLAKMQEEVARKEGRDENGPRGAKYIAKMGGVRKYQGGTPGSSNQLLKDFTQQQIDEKVQELAQREQFIQEGLGMYNEFLNRTQNRPTNSNRSNSNEEEPYINNFPGNPWGFSDQENWARRNVLDENIDMEGYIGGQDYGNIADTAWGKYYSEGPGSTEAERKLFNTNREKWYQDVYVPRVEEYINENPDEAYSMLQQMLNSSDPNAENFKTKLLDKDGNMLPQEAALKIAKELATDTKIGSFHAFLAPKLTELPILGPDVPGIEVDRDITLDRVELPKTPPKTPPGVKTPPDVLLPWQMMGPLAALGSKYPQPEKVAPQPSGRLNLPRVNFNAERAANASATNATNKYIQNQAAGPGAIAAQMANNSAQRQGNIEIANQEARANKDLMAQEAMSNLQASQFNAQNAMQADAMNAQSQNIRNQMEYEKRMNASTALGNAAAQYGMDQRAYRAEERMASANQISGEYDRQKYLEALKRDARKRNSPYANMSDAELKEIAAQAINQSPTWNAQDKARVEALSSAPTTKTEETDKKKKGGYIRRMNKIRR